MASKKTNSTIFTVAIVAIAAYAAYKWLAKPTRASASTAGGGSYVPSNGWPSDYYAPQQTTDPLSAMVNKLLDLLGKQGKGSSSGSAKDSGGASSASKAAQSSSSSGVDPTSMLAQLSAPSNPALSMANLYPDYGPGPSSDFSSAYNDSSSWGAPIDAGNPFGISQGDGTPTSDFYNAYNDSSSWAAPIDAGNPFATDTGGYTPSTDYGQGGGSTGFTDFASFDGAGLSFDS